MFRFSVSFYKENQPLKPDPDIFYYFKFHHLDYLSMEYLEKLDIKRISPLASIINIQFRGENEQKTISFLNKFLDSYLEENLAKKNKIALSTINFIDSQISEISDSLVLSESKLRNYRSANQVMDLSFQGQRIYEQMTQIETERANLQVQERYYNYIINYFKTNNDMSGVVPPSSMNVTDPIMNQLITDLLALNSQRSGILSNNSEKNLFLGQIENKIKIQKQAIIENVTNNLNTLNLSINELNYRSDKLSKEISKLPKTELNMVSMQRKFNLNDVIYTFLLQKRSEAAITLASNYPDFEILEPARDIQSILVAPKKKLNLLIAIFMAFLIPTLYIIGKDLFNETITSYHEIEHFLDRSIFGVIYSNDRKTEAVVVDYPGSFIAESFRNLRSNLFLKLKPEPSKIILITSTQPGDGKSFVSFNLAASIASVGYKTIIIDCDLRRPMLHNKFKNENTKGLSNYIINNASPDEISCKTFIENLSFIPAGPIIPKPSELIEPGVLDDLIITLKKEYEYIIIDTTPVGLVADASLLMKYASQILLIARNNYTRKDIFASVVDNFTSKQINNYEVVFNDLSFDKSPYKHYSNYYAKK
jgi:capsular exopolysaccharide synthesis family protein